MWEMFSNSVQLLLKGKLFREPGAALRQWLIGFAISAVGIVVLVKLGLPLGLAVVVVALAAGLLQPLLFKNLKYA
jgi:ABC-type nitrate/sulfonate/bicarbonate transport system permease component